MLTERLAELLKSSERFVSIFTTAGFPRLDSTLSVLKGIVAGGARLIELGMPFSDPIADGPTIQASSVKAIQNGMTLRGVLDIVREFRKFSDVPILLMGSINPVYRFGFDDFISQCVSVGVDGLIIPDMSVEVFNRFHADIMRGSGVCYVPLVTPTSDPDRIVKLEAASSGLLYVVSTFGVTGGSLELTQSQAQYLKSLNESPIRSKKLVGFGITNSKQIGEIWRYADGVVVGSAFLRHLETSGDTEEGVKAFVRGLIP